jgi:hypothetical protein
MIQPLVELGTIHLLENVNKLGLTPAEPGRHGSSPIMNLLLR